MDTALTVDPLLALLPTEIIQIQDAPKGTWRSVKAFVDREAPEEIFGANQGDRPRFLVEVPARPGQGCRGRVRQGSDDLLRGAAHRRHGGPDGPREPDALLQDSGTRRGHDPVGVAVMVAGAEVRIEFDKQKLADLVELLGKFPKALPPVSSSRALNRHSAVDAFARQHDAARASGFRLRPVRSRIHTSWAREDKLRATVYIDDTGFTLWLFRPVQNRMGVSPRAASRAFSHAFIATPWTSPPGSTGRPGTKSCQKLRLARITRWCAPARRTRTSTSARGKNASRCFSNAVRARWRPSRRPAAGRRNTPKRSRTWRPPGGRNGARPGRRQVDGSRLRTE